MRYEYQGIKLGDSIEKIINLLNNENTSFDDFYSYLIYEPGSAIEDIKSYIYRNSSKDSNFWWGVLFGRKFKNWNSN